VSKESEVASHEAELDDNPANAPEGAEYLSAVEPSESEGAEDDDEMDQSALERPRSVVDRDWRVYEVVNSITNEFGEKFKAMWA